MSAQVASSGGRSSSGYPGGSRKIDRALSDMKAHLDWLREHRTKHSIDPEQYRQDISREIGVMECMDMLRDRYHAKLIEEKP